jgi:KaiC/GvpD/RAD55 family RecA-like ATPase
MVHLLMKLSRETIEVILRLDPKWVEHVREHVVTYDGEVDGVVVTCPVISHHPCEALVTDDGVYHGWDNEMGQADMFWRQRQELSDFSVQLDLYLSPFSTVERLREEVEDEASREWLWHGFITPGNVTLIASDPKAGKTTLMFYVLGQMRGNLSALGFPTKRANIIYVTEEPRSTILERIETTPYFSLIHNDDIKYRVSEPGLDWSKILHEVEAEIPKLNHDMPKLLVIDTLSFFITIEDENDNAQLRKALKPLIELARMYNVAVLLIHHARKARSKVPGQAVRGGGAFIGLVDCVVELQRVGEGCVRVLKCVGRLSATPTEPVYYEYNPTKQSLWGSRRFLVLDQLDVPAEDLPSNDRAQRIRDYATLYPDKSMRAIARDLAVPYSAVNRAMEGD